MASSPFATAQQGAGSVDPQRPAAGAAPLADDASVSDILRHQETILRDGTWKRGLAAGAHLADVEFGRASMASAETKVESLPAAAPNLPEGPDGDGEQELSPPPRRVADAPPIPAPAHTSDEIKAMVQPPAWIKEELEREQEVHIGRLDAERHAIGNSISSVDAKLAVAEREISTLQSDLARMKDRSKTEEDSNVDPSRRDQTLSYAIWKAETELEDYQHVRDSLMTQKSELTSREAAVITQEQRLPSRVKETIEGIQEEYYQAAIEGYQDRARELRFPRTEPVQNPTRVERPEHVEAAPTSQWRRTIGKTLAVLGALTALLAVVAAVYFFTQSAPAPSVNGLTVAAARTVVDGKGLMFRVNGNGDDKSIVCAQSPAASETTLWVTVSRGDACAGNRALAEGGSSR